jgi:N-acetylmuramoyl-L-alanine amidase
MRWSSCAIVLAAVALFLFMPSTSVSTDEERISIYSTVANYSLPVVNRQGQQYVGLLEILEPLGKVSSRSDGNRWKIRYNEIDGEFTNGKTRGRVGGRTVELTNPFLVENGRGMVPLASLAMVMPRFLSGPVNFHESSRRLFIGNIATQFTVDLVKTTPPRLVLNFSTPVNPTISTEPGHLRMSFQRDAVVSTGAREWKFEDRGISGVTFAENNGSAELTVSGQAALMASFSAGGRTITVTNPVIAPPANVTSGTIAQTPRAAPTLAPPAPTTSVAAPTPRRFLIVIDASHGGEERGAALTEQLAEKDVTLAFARQLRRELEARGISVLMLRDSDVTLSLDQRAAATNAAHPAVYLDVHATSQGSGVRLYAALVPEGMENRGPFLDWSTAQAGAIQSARQIGNGAVAEMQKRKIPARTLSAPLRPLNNVMAPAVAVELSPPSSSVADVNLPAYQQPIAAALADFLIAQRATLEAQR